jgi:two-component sensor histidine kinase
MLRATARSPSPSGRVRVRWAAAGQATSTPPVAPRLRLDWVEEGGPPPTPPPLRRGFGTRLLESALPSQLGGSVSLRFEQSGLHATVEAALVPPGEPVYAPPPEGR